MKRATFLKALIGVPIVLQSVNVKGSSKSKKRIELKYVVRKDGSELYGLECSCGVSEWELEDPPNGYYPVKHSLEYQKFIKHKCRK